MLGLGRGWVRESCSGRVGVGGFHNGGARGGCVVVCAAFAAPLLCYEPSGYVLTFVLRLWCWRGVGAGCVVRGVGHGLVVCGVGAGGGASHRATW